MANLYETFEPAIQAPFQQGTYGTRWGAAFGNVKDQAMARLKLGVLARFPQYAPIDALGEISQERGIFQGVDETTEHFIGRLLNAFGAWTEGGTYWGLLAQLYGAGYSGAYIIAANGYVYGPSDGVLSPDPINPVDPQSIYLIPELGGVVWHVNGTDLNNGTAKIGPVSTRVGAIPYVATEDPIPSVGPFSTPPYSSASYFSIPANTPIAFGPQDFSVTVLVSVADPTTLPTFLQNYTVGDPNGFEIGVYSNLSPYSISYFLGETGEVNDVYDPSPGLLVVSFGYVESTQTMYLKVNNRTTLTAPLGADNAAPTTQGLIGLFQTPNSDPLNGQVFEILASTETPSDALFTSIYNQILANVGAIVQPPEYQRLPPWYTVGSAPTSLEWQATTHYSLNQQVTPDTQNGTYFVCTEAGTSGSSQPTWPGPGGSVTDGTVTWTYAGDYIELPFYPPWTFGGGNGQGAATTEAPFDGVVPAVGPGGDATPFWSRFLVLFDPPPASWSDIVNPPTTTSAPTASEIAVIREIIAKWKPGKSSCVGIASIASGLSKACIGWPLTTTPNIPVSSWLARAIATGDVPTLGAASAQHPQPVESWLANHTFTDGRTYIFMTPSFAYQNAHSPTLLFYATGASVTTGFIEPVWPTTIGGTVTDNGITWTACATLYEWEQETGINIFPA